MVWENVLCWIEAHPGLASWLQAIGAIVSIVVAFIVSGSQQRASLKAAEKVAVDRANALVAVIESAVLFSSALGEFVQQKPAPYVFKENWKFVHKQWLESSIFSLSQLPSHELASGELVRGYFAILGAMKATDRIIQAALDADAFHAQEFSYMYDQSLRQIRLIESNWQIFRQKSPKE